jgi:hypothetical protein
MIRHTALLILAATVLVHAQRNPCGETGLVYQLRWPERQPPVSIYMPYDVLLGYIALDSIINWATTYNETWGRVQQVRSFLERRKSFDDTLKKIVRSLYAMADYDPMLFEATLRSFRWPQLPPHMIYGGIIEAVTRAWANDLGALHRDLVLLEADYIAHVKVVDTVHRSGKFELDWTTLVVTTCQVLDLIKGQVLPPCNPAFTHTAPEVQAGTKQLKTLSSSGPCLQFTYVPNARLSGTTDIIEPDDERLGHVITPGNEYIVMLTFPFMCRDTAGIGDYYELHPLAVELPCNDEWHFNVSITAYPITTDSSGTAVVRMPKNEYGWGTEIPLTTFKQRLLDRIREIRNY